MNAKITMLAVAFGGVCLAASASALPITSLSGHAIATQVRDDESSDIGRRILRGFEGRSDYRDRDHDRRRDWEHRKYRERERGPRRSYDND
jgi:hypothetical protein